MCSLHVAYVLAHNTRAHIDDIPRHLLNILEIYNRSPEWYSSALTLNKIAPREKDSIYYAGSFTAFSVCIFYLVWPVLFHSDIIAFTIHALCHHCFRCCAGVFFFFLFLLYERLFGLKLENTM